MRYSFYRIGRMLKSAAGMYALVIVEMAVGTALLVACLNMFFSNQARLADSREQMAEEMITICWSGEALDDPGVAIMETAETTEEGYKRIYEGSDAWDYEAPFPIGYEEYQTIVREFGDDLVFYYGAIQRTYVGQPESFEGKYSPIFYVFMNDELFEYTFSFQREADKVYMGEMALEFYEQMESAHPEWAGEIKYPASMGKLWLSDDFGVEYTAIPKDKAPEAVEMLSYINSPGLTPEEIEYSFVMPLDHVVLLPETMLEHCILSSLMTPYNTLLVSYRDADAVDDQVPELLTRLMELRNGMSFKIEDAVLEAQKSIADQQNMVVMLTGASVTVLLIVLISTIGILLVLLARRRRFLALACCCGATMGRCYWELAAEVTAVFGLGALLGLVGGYAAVPILQAKLYDIQFYPVNIVIIAAFAVIAALLCCAIAIAGIRLRAPAIELKEL